MVSDLCVWHAYCGMPSSRATSGMYSCLYCECGYEFSLVFGLQQFDFTIASTAGTLRLVYTVGSCTSSLDCSHPHTPYHRTLSPRRPDAPAQCSHTLARHSSRAESGELAVPHTRACPHLHGRTHISPVPHRLHTFLPSAVEFSNSTQRAPDPQMIGHALVRTHSVTRPSTQ